MLCSLYVELLILSTIQTEYGKKWKIVGVMNILMQKKSIHKGNNCNSKGNRPFEQGKKCFYNISSFFFPPKTLF